MKVVREKEDFRPVMLTLESQDEVDALFTIVCNISGSGCFNDTSIREVSSGIFRALDTFGAESQADLVEIRMQLEK